MCDGTEEGNALRRSKATGDGPLIALGDISEINIGAIEDAVRFSTVSLLAKVYSPAEAFASILPR